MTEDNIPRYNKDLKDEMNISYYTHDGYSKCLAGKTLVFIGDSRVRYQYMHLASYMKSKRFMKCSDMSKYQHVDNQNEKECTLINEKIDQSQGWAKWYNISTAMLNDDTTQSLCDCHKPANGKYAPETAFENRYTKTKTKYGDVELIYLNSNVNKIRTFKEFPPLSDYASSSSSKERCKPGHCTAQSKELAFKGDLNSTIQNFLPGLCLNTNCHAFINYGWDYKYGFDMQNELTCTMERYEEQHTNIKLHLITGPEDRSARSYFDETKLKCKASVLNRNVPSKGVPREWYFDYFHVLSILNEEYNHRLVKKICPMEETR